MPCLDVERVRLVASVQNAIIHLIFSGCFASFRVFFALVPILGGKIPVSARRHQSPDEFSRSLETFCVDSFFSST